MSFVDSIKNRYGLGVNCVVPPQEILEQVRVQLDAKIEYLAAHNLKPIRDAAATKEKFDGLLKEYADTCFYAAKTGKDFEHYYEITGIRNRAREYFGLCVMSEENGGEYEQILFNAVKAVLKELREYCFKSVSCSNAGAFIA